MNTPKRASLWLLALTALGLSTSLPAQDATTTGGETTAGSTTSGSTTGGTTGGSTATGTGVFVYELKFKHLEGFNVDFWGGGWVVVPATGGVGGAVLTAIDDGRKEYVEASNSVAFYFAKTREKRYTVVAMGNGTAGGAEPLLSMQAFGESNHGISINTEVATIKVKAAKIMRGYAQASQDESGDATLSTDGTVGFVEFSEMKLDLDEDMTNRMNEKFGGDVGRAYTELVAEVQRRGYVERGDDGTGTGTGTATGGSTTAGSTTGGPSGGGDGSGSGDGDGT